MQLKEIKKKTYKKFAIVFRKDDDVAIKNALEEAHEKDIAGRVLIKL